MQSCGACQLQIKQTGVIVVIMLSLLPPTRESLVFFLRRRPKERRVYPGQHNVSGDSMVRLITVVRLKAIDHVHALRIQARSQ